MDFRQRQLGRPPVDAKTQLLLIKMKRSNPRLGGVSREILLRIGLNKPFAPVSFARKFFQILLSPIEMGYLVIALAGFSWIATEFAFTGHHHDA